MGKTFHGAYQKKAIALWGKLHPKLSGIAATARFVIDTPYGSGKISVPEENAWCFDLSRYKDFSGKQHFLNCNLQFKYNS